MPTPDALSATFPGPSPGWALYGPHSINLVPLPDDLPTQPEWWPGWLDQWPFGLIRQVFERLWNFVSRPISVIGTGVDLIFRNLFRGAYAWERSIFLDALPEDVRLAYPSPGDWMSTLDFVAMAFRLPFHALWSIVDKARDRLLAQLGTLGDAVYRFLVQLEQISYSSQYQALVASGALGPDARLRFPAPDPNWPLGTSLLHAFRLLGYATAFQVWQARDWLQGRITDLGQTLGPAIAAITSTLSPLINATAAVAGDTWTSVNTLLARIPTDLGSLLARITTAVTVDLPATLGGLAQAVADKVGPAITAALAGLGDLPARVRALLQPLLDGISASLGNLLTSVNSSFTSIIASLSGVTLAVITTIPGLVGGIIPTLSGVISGVQTSLSAALTAVQTALTTALTGVQTTLSAALTGVQTFLGAAIAGVRTSLGNTLTDLDTFLKDKLAAIKSALAALPSDLPDLVLGRLRDTLSVITSGLTAIPGQVRDLVKPLTDPLGLALTGIPQAVRDLVQPTLNSLTSSLAPVTSFFADLGDSTVAILDAITSGVDQATDLISQPPQPLSPYPPIAGGSPVPAIIAAIVAALLRLGPALGRLVLGAGTAFGISLGTTFGTTGLWYSAALAIPQIQANLAEPPAPGAVSLWNFRPFLSDLGHVLFDPLQRSIDIVGEWIDEGVLGLINHIKRIGVLTPTTADTALPSILTLTRTMALGLGGFALLGETIGFFKTIGLGHLSAIMWKLTNFELITGAAIGALAFVSLETPLKYYYNSLFRPNLPPLADFSMMYAKHQINIEEFRDKLPFYGFSPEIIGWYEEYIFRDPRLFEIVRLAEITSPPPEVPDQARRYLQHAGIPMEDERDWWYYYKFAKAGYEDLDIPVLVHVAKFAVSRKEQTQYMMQVRRLFRDGFITETRATELYQAGWVPKRPVPFRMEASLLERSYEVLDEKRAIILSSLRRGLVNDGEAYAGLVDLGLDPSRAALSLMSTRLGLIRTGRLISPEITLLPAPEEEEE